MPAERIELDGTEGLVELCVGGATRLLDALETYKAALDAGRAPSDAEALAQFNAWLAQKELPPLPNARSLQVLLQRLDALVEGWRKKKESAPTGSATAS